MLSGSFNIRSLSDAILVSTWLHFSFEKHPKTSFGSPLGCLGQVLGRLGGILGRLRMVLESSWAVFGRHVGLLGVLVGILRRLVDVLGRLGKKSSVNTCARRRERRGLLVGSFTIFRIL